MRPNLPSLTGLLAFEAVARHLSWTQAAKELNLTQSAISHQIRNLETQIGVTLFVRSRGAFKLTEAAMGYLPSVRSAIAELSDATGRMRASTNNSLLTVTALTSYAIKCLNPLLPELQEKLPDLRLRIFLANRFEDFEKKNYDLAIRYGHGDWPGFQSERLFGEDIFPVASPALIKETGNDLRILERMPIIRTQFMFEHPDDWSVWLQAAGIPDIKFQREIVFDQPIAALQAAVDGAGIALGRSPHVARDLAAGRLVAPWNIKVSSSAAYWLSASPEKMQLKKVKQFWNWMANRSRTADS